MLNILKNNRKEAGFTLVEIMIVVAIIGLLVAIAIPNLLRARVSANEAAAKASMRTIITGLENFRADQNPPSYPVSLATLGGTTPPYLDPQLAAGNKQGYNFTYFTATSVTVSILGTNYTVYPAYSLGASPVTAGQSGNATFYANSTGVVFSDQTGATAVPSAYAATAPSGFVPLGN